MCVLDLMFQMCVLYRITNDEYSCYNTFLCVFLNSHLGVIVKLTTWERTVSGQYNKRSASGAILHSSLRLIQGVISKFAENSCHFYII